MYRTTLLLCFIYIFNCYPLLFLLLDSCVYRVIYVLTLHSFIISQWHSLITNQNKFTNHNKKGFFNTKLFRGQSWCRGTKV